MSLNSQSVNHILFISFYSLTIQFCRWVHVGHFAFNQFTTFTFWKQFLRPPIGGIEKNFHTFLLTGWYKLMGIDTQTSDS